MAHAFDQDNLINPDDVDHQKRLQSELPLIKELAEILIEQDLGIKSKRTYYREHQYELEGFREALPSELVHKLDQGESFVLDKRATLGTISIELRDNQPYESLSNLTCTYLEAEQGILSINCASDDDLVNVSMRLNFPKTSLEFDFDRDIRVNNDGSINYKKHLKDCWSFIRDILTNGELEVNLSGKQVLLGRKDPYMPVNIDLNATLKDIEGIVSKLGKEIELMERGES